MQIGFNSNCLGVVLWSTGMVIIAVRSSDRTHDYKLIQRQLEKPDDI